MLCYFFNSYKLYVYMRNSYAYLIFIFTFIEDVHIMAVIFPMIH